MAKFKNVLFGVLIVFLGVLFLFFGNFMIEGFSGILPDDGTITASVLTILFWVGVVALICVCLIVTPILLVMGDDVNFVDMAKGIMIFAGGSAVCGISYYLVIPMIESLNEFMNIGNVEGLMWIFIGLLWFLIMIVAPNYIILRERLDGENILH